MTTGSASDVDSFTYDPNTNRPTNLTYSIDPTTSPYTVTTALTWNALNLPITIATTARTTTATYDALGLMVEMDATASLRKLFEISS